MVDGANMPAQEEFPQSLLPLRLRNAIEISDGRNFKHTTEVLIGVLEGLMNLSYEEAKEIMMRVTGPTVPRD